jgi:hypothetical protein
MSGKIGYWTYWFKSENGFDIDFVKNKKDLPKGYKFVKSFRSEYMKDGKDCADAEILDENNKVLWFRRNIHDLSECERMNLTHEVQYNIHKLLNVLYPEKAYRKLMEKKIKGCIIRRIKE